MKKKLALGAVFGALLVSLAACGASGEESTGDVSAAKSSTASVSTKSSAESPIQKADAVSAESSGKGNEETGTGAESASEAASSASSAAAEPEPTPVYVETTGFYTSSSEALTDILAQIEGEKHVFLFDASETFEEYYVYTTENGQIDTIYDIGFFFEDYYTWASMEELDLNAVYPGFYDMDFTSESLEDSGEFFVLLLTFENLNKPENVAALRENGILGITDETGGTINAEAYRQYLLDNGKIELDPVTLEPIG